MNRLSAFWKYAQLYWLYYRAGIEPMVASAGDYNDLAEKAENQSIELNRLNAALKEKEDLLAAAIVAANQNAEKFSTLRVESAQEIHRLKRFAEMATVSEGQERRYVQMQNSVRGYQVELGKAIEEIDKLKAKLKALRAKAKKSDSKTIRNK